MRTICSYIAVLAVLLSIAVGCDRFRKPVYYSTPANMEEIAKLKTVAILPALNAKRTGEGVVVCPVCHDVIFGPVPKPGISEELSRRLRKCFIDERGLDLMPLLDVREITYEKVPIYFRDPISNLRRQAELLKVDAIIVPALLRYVELEGSAIGANKPASVAFDVHLIRSSDMVTLWKGKYDEEEKPVSSDLGNAPLYFKRGVKWHKADELMSFGIKELCGDFPMTRASSLDKAEPK